MWIVFVVEFIVSEVTSQLNLSYFYFLLNQSKLLEVAVFLSVMLGLPPYHEVDWKTAIYHKLITLSIPFVHTSKSKPFNLLTNNFFANHCYHAQVFQHHRGFFLLFNLFCYTIYIYTWCLFSAGLLAVILNQPFCFQHHCCQCRTSRFLLPPALQSVALSALAPWSVSILS